MRLDVLLFASYADAFGAQVVAVDLPQDGTVGDVIARLRQLTGGRSLPPAPLVAVNQRYARADQRLAAGDEIAVIPPVAGG